MTSHASVRSILDAAREALRHSEVSWNAYLNGANEPLQALHSAIMSARSVTFILQNAKNQVSGFDEWWAEHVQVLNNPTAQWFVKVRNMIEKQGQIPGAGASFYIPHFDSSELLGNPPPGAKEFFFADRLGRSGWIIERPDGRDEIVYANLSREDWAYELHADDAPDGKSIEQLFPDYLDQLRTLYEAAQDAWDPITPANTATSPE